MTDRTEENHTALQDFFSQELGAMEASIERSVLEGRRKSEAMIALHSNQLAELLNARADSTPSQDSPHVRETELSEKLFSLQQTHETHSHDLAALRADTAKQLAGMTDRTEENHTALQDLFAQEL